MRLVVTCILENIEIQIRFFLIFQSMMRIYNRALSSSEVFALYQFEKPIYFSTSSPLSIFENLQAARKLVIFFA